MPYLLKFCNRVNKLIKKFLLLLKILPRPTFWKRYSTQSFAISIFCFSESPPGEFLGDPWGKHVSMAAIRCSFRTACSPKVCRQLSEITSPFFRQQHTKSIEEYGSLNVSWRREILNGTIDYAMTELVNQIDACRQSDSRNYLRFCVHTV